MSKQRSKRKKVYAYYHGHLLTLSEIARRSGKSYGVVRHRVLNNQDVDAPTNTKMNPYGRQRRVPDFDVDAEHADECVDEVVRRHPDGLKLEEVGLLIGLVRERVRQIQDRAIAKLRAIDPDTSKALKALRDAYEAKRESYRPSIYDELEMRGFGWEKTVSVSDEEVCDAAE